MNSHVSLNSVGVLLISVPFFYVVFGAGPNKRDFSGFGGAGTWKIRKCIDACIACRVAIS